MKKSLFSFLILQAVACISAFGQDIILLDGLTPNFFSCNGLVTDQGFTVSDYSNDSDILATVCSTNGDGFQLDFTEFEIEDGFDFLTIYDGPDQFSPQVAGSPFTGTTVNSITSTGTCLTFHFTSNSTVTAPGWAADLICVPIDPPADCLVAYDFSISPPYEPGDICSGGTSYSYCLTITDWVGASPNEFHGFDLTFASGIDASSLVPVSFPLSCDGLGTWGFYTSVTSAGTGLITGPGFFYDADGDGDPGNNAGDACLGALPWTFCFDVNTDPCQIDGSNNGESTQITINTYSDGESGLFDDPTCNVDELITIDGSLGCAPPCPGDCFTCPPIASFVALGPITVCPSESVVSLDITVEFFDAPYTITVIENGITSTISSSSSNLVIDVTPDPGLNIIELLSITDASCMDVLLGATIQIISVPPPTISFLQDAEICVDGSVDLEFDFFSIDNPPSPPYELSYTIDGTPGGSFTSLTDNFILNATEPGFYELSSITYNGCTEILNGPSVTLTPADTVFAEISGDTTVCENQSVELDIFLTGTPPFQVAISLDGLLFDIISNFTDGMQTYTVSQEGTYTISFVSDIDCIGIPLGSATVSYFDVSTVSLSGGGFACTGTDVDLLFESTGNAPWLINYSIDGIPQAPLPVGGSPFTLLTQTNGLYTLSSATDGNGCDAIADGQASAVISSPPTAELSGDIELCSGDIGNLNLLLTGNDPFIIEYEIDGILQPADTIDLAIGTLTVLQTGTYTLLSVTDSICTGTASGMGTVVVSPTPLATISGEDSVCTGSVVELLIELNGTPTYSVDIFLNGIFYQNFNTDNDSILFEVTEPGEYVIEQLTDMNCPSTELDSVVIANYPIPLIETTNDTLLCIEESLILTGSASGGFGGPYSYQWLVSGDTLSTDSITISPFETDTYEFLVDDGCGVLNSHPVVVGVHPFPSFDVDGLGLGICGEGTLVLDTEIPISLFGDSCVWNVNGQIFNVCDSIEIQLTTADAYDVELFVLTVQGCIFDTLFSDLIQVNSVPIAGFSYTPTQPSISEDLLNFQDLSTGATTYNWLLDSLLFSNEASPTLDLPDKDDAHAYTVCMAVQNEFGCVDTTCQLIKIEGDLIVYIPSAFTPDNDLVNDSWAPVIIGAIAEEYVLKIYGRNGQVIWESRDINERWNGQGADDQDYYSGDSMYQWLLEVRRTGSVDKRTYQGIVTLLR